MAKARITQPDAIPRDICVLLFGEEDGNKKYQEEVERVSNYVSEGTKELKSWKWYNYLGF